jgi:hypothetical protein
MQDTVSKDIGGRFPGMVIGPPRTKAHTAFVTASQVENNGGVEGPYETGIAYRFERQGGSPALPARPRLYRRQAAWSQIRIQTSERFGSR